MNNSLVKFKTINESNLSVNTIIGKDCEGAFIYNLANKRLYLFDGSSLITVGKNVLQINEENSGQTYEDNTFYVNSTGDLFFVANNIKHQIARIDDIGAAHTEINEQIESINSTTNALNADIVLVNEKIGNPGAIGDNSKPSTGIYALLDEKVNTTAFETYKTEQAEAFKQYQSDAEDKFLSADEDLFLSSGYVKYGEFENDDFKEVAESDGGKPYIVLELKNNTDTDGVGEQVIYIAATDLVDVYTGVNTDTLNLSVNGLEISGSVNADKLIDTTSDIVTLSVAGNKIKAAFDTASIIDNSTDSIDIAVEKNKLSAEVNKANIIDGTTLKVTNEKIAVDLNSLVDTSATGSVQLTVNDKNMLSASLTDAGAAILTQAGTALSLISNNDANIKKNKEEFDAYVESHESEFAQHEQAFSALENEFNQHEQTFNDFATEFDQHEQTFNAFVNAVGTYEYSEKTTNQDARGIATGDYFVAVNEHIEGEAAEIRTELSVATAELSNSIGTLDSTIDSRLTDTIGSYVYTKTEDEEENSYKSTGTYFNTVRQHIEAIDSKHTAEEGALNAAITNINTETIPAINEEIANINTITIPAVNEEITSINTVTIPAINEEITNINTVTIPTINEEIASLTETVNAAVVLEEKDNQFTVSSGAIKDYVDTEITTANQTIETAYLAKDQVLQGNIDNIGNYTYASNGEEENPTYTYTVTPGTHLATVKQHIEEIDGKHNVEEARLEGLITANTNNITTITGTTIPSIQNDITTITGTTIPSIQNDITEITGATIPQLEQAISDLGGNAGENTVSSNAAQIQALTENFNAAITLAEDDKGTVLWSGGLVKDYIDAADLALSNRIQAIEDVDYQTVANATARFTTTTTTDGNGQSVTNYEGEIVDAYTAADSAIEAKFIVADNELKKELKGEDDKVREEFAAADIAITISGISVIGDNTTSPQLQITYADHTAEQPHQEKYDIAKLLTVTNFNTKLADYYTKTEADQNFLSADENLFLTSGSIATGNWSGDTFTEATDGTDKAIKLVLKDKTPTDGDVTTIYVDVKDLVKEYTEGTTGNVSVSIKSGVITADLDVDEIIEKDSETDITLAKTTDTNKIQASLSSTIVGKINDGAKAYARQDTYVSDLTAAYQAKTEKENEAFTITIEQSGDNGESQSVDILTNLNAYIETKDYVTSDKLEAALTDYTNTENMGTAISTAINAIYEEKTDNNTTTYAGSVGTHITDINADLAELDEKVDTLQTTDIPAIGTYSYTAGNEGAYGVSAASSESYFAEVKDNIDALKQHVDDNDANIRSTFDGYLPLSGGTLTDSIKLESSATTAAGQPTISWKSTTVNNENVTPTIGLAQDQSDGTFVVMSVEGIDDYKKGLSIGGTSKNLFWKGNQVAVISDGIDDADDDTIKGAKAFASAAASATASTLNTTLSHYGIAAPASGDNYAIGDGLIKTAIADTETGINNTLALYGIATPEVNTDAVIGDGLIKTALNTKMDKANPTGTGSFRLNKGPDTITLDSGEEYEVTIGENSTALGDRSIAEGYASYAEGYSWAGENAQIRPLIWLGGGPSAGSYAHAEGLSTAASGVAAHAEGDSTTASGDDSHAEGYYTVASGESSHAEGSFTVASGESSHAEGSFTVASGNYSHASGSDTIASGMSSCACGEHTEAKGIAQMVIGRYNLPMSSPYFIVGNGTTDDERNNAFTIGSDGTVHIYSETEAVKKATGVSEAGALIVDGGVLVKKNVIANKVYGSVWNDYAEYRQTHHKVRPGQCVYEKGDGSLAISYERMMPGANIVSDTFGFAIGETDECKTPLAVSGRVLAYPYESKETYNPGDAVCSGPNGTISKMTRAEIRDYPERIVGTVSEIPTYEVWGSGNIKVNGRIWIKVR